MYPTTYQVMYVDKNYTYFAFLIRLRNQYTFFVEIVVRSEIGGARKLAALSINGPPNERGGRNRNNP